jgi:hypothetical protein
MKPKFKIPDYPNIRPRVPEVLTLVQKYYSKNGNEAGGNCHIALDDGNLSDRSLQFCVERCQESSDWDGKHIMELMLLMTRSQRRRIRFLK